MANENEKNVNGEVKTEGAVQNAPAAEPVNAAPQQGTTEEKKGFKAWLKKHWKGAAAGLAGALALGGSAVVAYKKGKAAGIMSVPVEPTEDYSLNPNE